MRLFVIVSILFLAGCSSSDTIDSGLNGEGGALMTPSPSSTAIPSVTLSPSHTPTMTPSPQQFVVITEMADKWILYEDKQIGVSFEYPAIYDHPDYIWCRPIALADEETGNIRIYFTETAKLSIEQSASLSAEQLLDEVKRRDEEEEEFSLYAFGDSEVLGSPGYYVNYWFGGRFFVASFADLPDGKFVFVEQYPNAPSCNFPEIGLDFWEDAYRHFEETLQLND